MKHPLKYLAAFLVLFISLGANLSLPLISSVGLIQPAVVSAAPGPTGTDCNLFPSTCGVTPTNPKVTPVTKACPASLSGFPTIQSPNLINTPSPDNRFVQCEIDWAQSPGNNAYVPGHFEGGNGDGVADYCSRNFTSTYRASCNSGFSDGAGAECDKDKACAVGAYARVQLDKQGQNNSKLNPTSKAAQDYCDGKTGKEHKACVAGYQGQTNGKTKEEACKNLNGDLLRICSGAWNQSKTDAAKSEDSELGCDASFDNPLTWIICPVIDLLSDAIALTDNLITQQMVLPAQDIFCINKTGDNDTCDAYYAAWASFRNIALGLIAIAGLIIIIAQAIGMEILDAYTIRKMLPRILLAAVAITLSWPLMNFAVTLSNNLGFGVRDLIVAPFESLSGEVSINFSSIGAIDFITGFTGVVIGGALAITFGGLGLLLSYVATAGLAVLVAIMVLVLREIAVIMLIILSPIAIVAYVMPNTQRVFRLWWESFSRALLMFPMIAGFIAAGRVFAAISLSGNEDNLFNQIVGFVAYFAPYFMIPLTFRLSGGVMSGLGNMVNQRAQPGFERLKKGRAEGYARKWQQFQDGTRLHEDFGPQAYRGFARRFNRATAGTANLRNAGYNPYHMKDRMAAARSTRQWETGLKAMQEDPDLKYALSNDDIAESLIPGVESYQGSGHFGGGDDAARRQFLMDRTYTQESGLEEMVAAGRATQRKLPSNLAAQTAWMANWSTGTGFSEKTWDEVQPDGSKVTRRTGNTGEAFMALADMTKGSNGGDQLRANMIAQAREGATRQRRSDFHGQSFTEQMLLAREVAGPGYGEGVGGPNGSTRAQAAQAIAEKIRKGAAFGKSRGEHITGRPQAIKAMVPQLISNFDQILETDQKGIRRQLMEELSLARSGQQSAGQASPENAKEHAKYMQHEIILSPPPADVAKRVKGAFYLDEAPQMSPEVRDVIVATAKVKEKKTNKPVDRLMVQDLIDINDTDPDFRGVVYQYGSQYQQDEARAAQEALKQGQPPPPPPPPPPGG